MIFDIEVKLNYIVATPTDLIVQIRAQNAHDQIISGELMDFGQYETIAHADDNHGSGQRTLMRTSGDFSAHYKARAEITRAAAHIETLNAVPISCLSADAVRYLMPSRYCACDELQSFVSAEFGHVEGGERIATIADWIFENFDYVSGSSTAQTTAIDSLVQRQGICRDFAHVLIALSRASAIPARYVSAYAPRVAPQDFHAVAEVFLDGQWHLVDPTRMAKAEEIVRIGAGMDAAEVAFLNSFGKIDLRSQSVRVSAVS